MSSTSSPLEGSSIQGGGKRKVNKSLKAWVTFVKKVQKEEGINYKEAIHRAKVRKDKGEKWMTGGGDPWNDKGTTGKGGGLPTDMSETMGEEMGAPTSSPMSGGRRRKSMRRRRSSRRRSTRRRR
jgi:hypothetical protein